MSYLKNNLCSKPHVVVAVFIIKDDSILIGRRSGSLGHGTWCIPGGKLELGEEFDECARREILEEAGILIKNLRLGTVVNDYSIVDGWHYTTICFVADYASGTVKIMEPQKCSEWRWSDWNNLPEPLYTPLKTIVEQGFNPMKK